MDLPRVDGLKVWSTNRQGWWRLRRSSSRVVPHQDMLLVLLEAYEVVEPLWVTCAGERVKILDDGYAWLFVLKEGARHVVTAHCDASGTPVHWYVDVVEEWRVGADGFPEYTDLFLDVIGTPSTAEVLDAEELKAALLAGVVTPDQYANAWREAEHVLHAFQARSFLPALRTREYLEAARAQ